MGLDAAMDVGAAVLCALLLVGYEWQVRRQRDSLPSLNNAARSAWIEFVMAKGDAILVIQTLRNTTMAATFLASTALLVVIGVINIAGQTGSLAGFWHALDVHPESYPALWMAKLLAIIFLLLAAFFFFTNSIRLLNHVGYLASLPDNPKRVLQPDAVARIFNQAGSYFALGFRAYYFSVPAFMWLFGPFFVAAATLLLLVALARIDRAGK
jgi:uncharacterized membrane protein